MDVIKAINERRAYRFLDPAEVNLQTIKDLAQNAALAPSCFNHQPWRYIFVYDKTMLEALKPALSKGNEWVFDASMIIAVLSKKDMDCVMKDGRDYYLFDAGLSTAFLVLRATELGLVAHPIAGYNPQIVKEVLGVPEDYSVITLVNVGKHSSQIKPALSEAQAKVELSRPERLPLGEIAFVNRFNNKLPA